MTKIENKETQSTENIQNTENTINTQIAQETQTIDFVTKYSTPASRLYEKMLKGLDLKTFLEYRAKFHSKMAIISKKFNGVSMDGEVNFGQAGWRHFTSSQIKFWETNLMTNKVENKTKKADKVDNEAKKADKVDNKTKKADKVDNEAKTDTTTTTTKFIPQINYAQSTIPQSLKIEQILGRNAPRFKVSGIEEMIYTDAETGYFEIYYAYFQGVDSNIQHALQGAITYATRTKKQDIHGVSDKAEVQLDHKMERGINENAQAIENNAKNIEKANINIPVTQIDIPVTQIDIPVTEIDMPTTEIDMPVNTPDTSSFANKKEQIKRIINGKGLGSDKVLQEYRNTVNILKELMTAKGLTISEWENGVTEADLDKYFGGVINGN